MNPAAQRPPLGAIRLPENLHADRDAILWPALLDLADHVPTPWVLIGGQMVYLHGLIAGRVPPRVTEDVDLLFDLRAELEGITKADRVLSELGYTVDGISPDGLAHRYIRGDGMVVDILGPDGLGDRGIELRLRSPHGRTVAVPGGSKALEYAHPVEVSYRDRTSRIYLPDLPRALVGKVRALSLPQCTSRVKSRHLDDIAFLVSLIDDPDAYFDARARPDPRFGTSVTALDDRNHPSWTKLGDHAEDAFLAWEQLRHA
ncbi:nucleotidyl transferase AbiEii/AbiGii toxin family protein [Saccharopolyspora cebuensis]|uniref:nucleotidyl transferase AbiEii/AbiGii toxin family protein n=1 Tax=Saccharopolyspora cebuensis TaxID=418759 RepID=UPI0031E77C0B